MRLATKRESALASSSSTEPERFVVGRLGRPHGLDGFVGLYIDEADAAALTPGATLFVAGRALTVRTLRRVDRGYQIAFEGIDDREAAEEIRGRDVEVASRRALDAGEFWPDDLIGLTVVDEAGTVVGEVVEVVFGAAQERLVVERPDGTRHEVPFVDALVPEVDLAEGRVEIVPIPGLIER